MRSHTDAFIMSPMRFALSVFVVSLLACSSTTSGSLPPASDAAVDTRVPGVDAATDMGTPPDRPALAAFASPTGCSTLRASSQGFHTFCFSRGTPQTDFAGAPLPTAADGVRTVIFASPDGKTKWAKPTCEFHNNWVDMDGLPTGEAVVAGTINKPCTLGSTTLSVAGMDDGMIARFDATGTLQWAHRLASTGGDETLQVRLDAAGNAIVAGNLGGAPDSTSLPVASGGRFVAKISPAGDVVWTKTFAKSYAQRVGVGPDNAVYVLSTLSETEDFGGGPIPVALRADVLAVVKYAADGSFLWQRAINMDSTPGATGGTIPTPITVASDTNGGAWFVIGYSGLDVSFGDVKLTSPGKENANVVGHLDDKGAALGGHVFEDRFSVLSAYLATGPSGTAFFGTSYQGLPGYAFLASFGVNGKPSWTAALGESSSTYGLAFDGAAIMVLGNFRKALALGVTTLTPKGSDDTFIARYAP